MRKLGLIVGVSLSVLVGCGKSSPATLNTDAVMKAFSAEGITLHTDRSAPEAILLPRSRPSDSAFVVWVYPSTTSATAAASRQAASLTTTARQWEKLTGHSLRLGSNVQRVLNVVVLRAVGLPNPASQIAAALKQLRGEK